MFPLITTGNWQFQPSEKEDDAASVIDCTSSNNPLQEIGNIDEPTNYIT